MNNITPQIKKELKHIATNLPTVLNETIEYHWLTGRELKQMDIEKDEHGEPLNDDKKYRWAMPVHLASNHYRIMKKLYLKNGEAEIIKYIRKVKALSVA